MSLALRRRCGNADSTKRVNRCVLWILSSPAAANCRDRTKPGQSDHATGPAIFGVGRCGEQSPTNPSKLVVVIAAVVMLPLALGNRCYKKLQIFRPINTYIQYFARHSFTVRTGFECGLPKQDSRSYKRLMCSDDDFCGPQVFNELLICVRIILVRRCLFVEVGCFSVAIDDLSNRPRANRLNGISIGTYSKRSSGTHYRLVEQFL
mgnify:CR=1 FL=1